MLKYFHTQLYKQSYNNDVKAAVLYGRQLPFFNVKTYNSNEQDKSSDEDVNLMIRDSFKPYPNRRSFYAMRGKRRAILP
ncbi:unnamed protein product [Adineta ricciae]|uniref:Uncharacterized protein n=1 Tax=Adineta ricciae TaxID=249248 RepID=A0A813SHA2_ADIRI|nr:unnamed protein product [Adineta ricciae]